MAPARSDDVHVRRECRAAPSLALAVSRVPAVAARVDGVEARPRSPGAGRANAAWLANPAVDISADRPAKEHQLGFRPRPKAGTGSFMVLPDRRHAAAAAGGLSAGSCDLDEALAQGSAVISNEFGGDVILRE